MCPLGFAVIYCLKLYPLLCFLLYCVVCLCASYSSCCEDINLLFMGIKKQVPISPYNVNDYILGENLDLGPATVVQEMNVDQYNVLK